MNIKVNFHSSIIINDEIFVDPLKVDEEIKAKYIFITHPHWDHFSIEDIKKIITDETIFVCPTSMKEEISQHFNNKILPVVAHNSYKIGNIRFVTFASYNIDKKFHPKEDKWVGYILEIDGENVAIVGDSDNTSEIRNIKTDILLIPIGGTYTMTFEEAAEATNIINPKLVIPTHYGEIVGDKEMGVKFKNLLNKNIICDLLLG